MCSIYDEKYKNNVCNFKTGDIVRFKGNDYDKNFGEMKIVEIAQEIKGKIGKNRTRKRVYMYNYLKLVPKDFCSKCIGVDDMEYFDVVRSAFEGHIYKV